MSIAFWIKEIYYALINKKLGTLWYGYNRELDLMTVQFLKHKPEYNFSDDLLYININKNKYTLEYDSYDQSIEIGISNNQKRTIFFNPSSDRMVSNKTVYMIKQYVNNAKISDNMCTSFSNTVRKNECILNLINKK